MLYIIDSLIFICYCSWML